jgi:hypothetical protein
VKRKTAVAILLVLGSCAVMAQGGNAQTKGVDAEGHAWWQHAVFYEIYPRSFADSNNDGVGEFEGDYFETGLFERTGRECDLDYAVFSFAASGFWL